MSQPPPPVSGRYGSDIEPFGASSALVDGSNTRDAASDDISSPPPAPSSGTGVRRNHTIHGVRHPAEPRLERHFEQPQNASRISGTNAFGHAHSSSPSSSDLATDSGSSHSSAAVADLASGLTPLQALYAKSTVSRNHSLPSRNSSKLMPGLPPNAAQGRSNLFNSLSAITGGTDVDEHDWEKLIRSGNVLDTGTDLPIPSLQTESSWSDSLFDHRRFPSGPASAHRHSPVARSEHMADPHRFNGSSMAMDALDVGAFAPSAASNSSGFIRRHQSLNHNSGRLAADRLAARSSRLPGGNERAAGTGSLTPSYSTRIEYPFSPDRQANSVSASSSPIAPIGHARTPWSAPSQDVIGSPSRYAGSFASQNVMGGHNPADTFADLSSPPALGLHSDLAKLSMSEAAPSHPGSRNANVHTGSNAVLDSLPMRPPFVSHNSSSSFNSNMGRKLPSLVTNRDDMQQNVNLASIAPGPASAAAFVPPIGHGHTRQQSHDPFSSHQGHEYDPSRRFGPYTAGPQGHWQDKERIAGRSDSNAFQSVSPRQNFDTGAYRFVNDMEPNMRALSMALAHEQQNNAISQASLGVHTHTGGHDTHLFGMTSMNPTQSIAQQLRGSASSQPGAMGHLPNRAHNSVHGPRASLANQHAPAGAVMRDANAQDGAGSASTPPQNLMPLAMQKGYNPPSGSFDLTPPSARFFVIKSYTEADVHKSLKYEIWASTDKGNQRLDKAFRDSAHSGPIYLFYSVNASGHFCGMAQMLTPLDYTTSSNVWAQDGKWKGTFKVRWILVKDLPNNQLRHIRLTNTQECKPVTQSRDTQELTPEAGREVLKIMSAYTAKTSLLQDFQFYEMQGKQILPPGSIGPPSTISAFAAGSPDPNVAGNGSNIDA